MQLKNNYVHVQLDKLTIKSSPSNGSQHTVQKAKYSVRSPLSLMRPQLDNFTTLQIHRAVHTAGYTNCAYLKKPEKSLKYF